MKSLVGSIVDKTPVPYFGRRVIGAGTLSSSAGGNREAQAAAYGANGTLFAIVAGIALDVSAATWRLYRKSKTGRREDRVEVLSHAAIDVWNRPNPFMPGQEYREIIQQHLDLTGEGWNLLSRGSLVDWPLEMWPVFPHRMTPIPDRENFIAGYVYRSPDGEKVPLEVRDVALLRQPHPLDMLRGLGVVQAISVDLDTARAAGAWNRNFFLNSATPGGIVEVPTRLDDDEFDEFNERWREQHQGVANAHRVALLEQGMKWVDRSYTMRDMQFVELRGVSREAIREAFRYPVAMLGESKDVNRAVAAAQKAIYVENLVIPRLDRWKGFANHDFLPAFGATAEGLEWDYDSPLPADKEADNADRDSKATSAKTYVEAGFTGDSVAEALRLPPGLVWKQPAPAQPAASTAPAGGLTVSETAWSSLVGRLTRRALNEVEVRAEFNPDAVQSDWRHRLDALLDDWQAMTGDLADSMAAQIRAAVNNDDPAALTSITVSSTAGGELLAEAMAALAATAAGRVADEAAAQDVHVDPPPLTAATFTTAAAAAATLVVAGWALSGAREGLRWYGYGHTGDQTATAVTDYLANLSTASLSAQLGGALTWAQNAGRLATLDSAPKARYYASEVLDSNTCKPCRRIDGKELPTLDAARLAYGGGGYLHCLGTVRCRGTMIAIWE